MGKLKADITPVWDQRAGLMSDPAHAKWPLKSQLFQDQDPALQVGLMVSEKGRSNIWYVPGMVQCWVLSAQTLAA